MCVYVVLFYFSILVFLGNLWTDKGCWNTVARMLWGTCFNQTVHRGVAYGNGAYACQPARLPSCPLLLVLYRPVWAIRLFDAQHFLPSLSAALCRRCVTYVLHDSSRCPVQQRGRFGDAARGREPFLEGGLPPASIVGAEVARTKRVYKRTYKKHPHE